MSEHTPITGELRKMVKQAERIIPLEGMAEDMQVRVNLVWLREKLDAIDAIHANLERENARLKAECDEAEHRGWTRGYDEGFADADDVLEVFEEYGVLDEHGWVKLPKDADGEVWHIGDRTESGQTIEAMGLNKHGWHFVGTVNEIDPAIHRHYHAQTVEDVLFEFVDRLHDTPHDDILALFAEYAAKLRLAGDAE